MGKTIEQILVKKARKIMLDPTIFTSDNHLQVLMKYPEKLYVPQTFLEILLKKEKINNFMFNFIRRPWKYNPVSKIWVDLYQEGKLIGYTTKKVYMEELLPHKEKIKVSEEVWQVLLEEYSFLRENSCLLLRIRSTMQHFKQMGISILDATNNFRAEKEKVFHKIKGPMWIVAILIETAKLMSSIQSNQSAVKILEALRLIMIFFDP